MVNVDVIDRIKEIAFKHCADYPNIEEADSLELLCAIEQTLEGISLANKDLHDYINRI